MPHEYPNWPIHDTRGATDFEIHIDTTKPEFRLPNGAIDPRQIWRVLEQHAVILEKGGMLPGADRGRPIFTPAGDFSGWSGPIASAEGAPGPVGHWTLHCDVETWRRLTAAEEEPSEGPSRRTWRHR